MSKTFAINLLCLIGLSFLSSAHADTPLEISMQHTAKAMKQLALDLKAPVDTSKDDYVALATTMKTEAQTARGLVPKKIAALPADQQPALIASYQKSMDDLGATIDTLIQALQGSQWDAARQTLDKIRAQETEGHKQFRVKKA